MTGILQYFLLNDKNNEQTWDSRKKKFFTKTGCGGKEEPVDHTELKVGWEMGEPFECLQTSVADSTETDGCVLSTKGYR